MSIFTKELSGLFETHSREKKKKKTPKIFRCSKKVGLLDGLVASLSAVSTDEIGDENDENQGSQSRSNRNGNNIARLRVLWTFLGCKHRHNKNKAHPL